jgi:hypothetical protein
MDTDDESETQGWRMKAPDYSSEAESRIPSVLSVASISSSRPIRSARPVQSVRPVRALKLKKKVTFAKTEPEKSDDSIFLPSSSDELIQEQKPVLRRSTRNSKPKTSFDEKKNNIIERYEMSLPDVPEDEIYVETDEESYSGELSESLRKEMGLENRDVLLYRSLVLLEAKSWKNFLSTPIIRKRFGPVLIVLQSCSGGFAPTKNMEIWGLAWEGKLIVQTLNEPISNIKCISCAYDRTVSHALYNSFTMELIGYMGPSCYKIRFSKILDLIEVTKTVAKNMVRWELIPGTSEFNEFVDLPITKAIRKVIKAPKEMVEKVHHK